MRSVFVVTGLGLLAVALYGAGGGGLLDTVFHRNDPATIFETEPEQAADAPAPVNPSTIETVVAQAPSAPVVPAPAMPAIAPVDAPTIPPAGAVADAPEATSSSNTVAQAISPTAAPTSAVPDETALRYFASRGDIKRLEAEIARLKALYPSWTPPANPLAVPEHADTQLETMWKLYSEGKYAEVRKAIGDRQASEPSWQVPADLLAMLGTAEAREQIINASDLKQYDTVLRVSAANPSLLTCADVEVLWRVGEAFASTGRSDRAQDAYGYILDSCDNPQERLATVQKAMAVLSRADLDFLLSKERKDGTGAGEFASIRPDLARQSVAAGNEDPKLVVPPADLSLLERLAAEQGLVSDDLLLGWHYLRRDNTERAQEWFRKARDKEDTAESSQGLALALIDLKRPAEAEDILYRWRDDSVDVKAVYLAAVANMLATVPVMPVPEPVLQRVVPVVYEARDAASAQQLGWYADAMNQFRTAEQWFVTVLRWKPDDEPSAYGLTLMRWKLGNTAGVTEMQRLWAGRSERIARVGEPEPKSNPRRIESVRPAEPVAPPAEPAPPVAKREEVASREPRPEAEPRAAPARRTGAPRRSGCTSTLDPSTLRPDAALARGWCLLDINRPLEAAAAFEVGLRSSSERARRDAAYGQSLAYLRAGLSDDAAVAAAKAPQDIKRSVELQTALLAAQATGAFEAGRYVESLLALDERARIAPERIDLLVLRGYAYLKLNRYEDATRTFRAAAGTGNRDAIRGLSAVEDARRSYRD